MSPPFGESFIAIDAPKEFRSHDVIVGIRQAQLETELGVVGRACQRSPAPTEDLKERRTVDVLWLRRRWWIWKAEDGGRARPPGW